jgi:Spy/CpxP family protein refolding chaperone
MFTKTVLSALTVAFALTAAPSVASAGGKGHRFDVCEAVTCTDAQAKQIQSLREAKKAMTKPIREQSKAVKAQLHAEMAKDKPDAKRVEDLRGQLDSLRAESKQHREAYVAQLKEVLTAEQFAKIEQIKAEHKKDWKGKKGKKGKGEKNGKDHAKGKSRA